MTSGDFGSIWQSHRTIREVAAAAGMSRTKAHGMAKSLGLPAKRRTRARSQNDIDAIAAVQALRAEGKTYRQIAAAVGKGLGFAHKYGRSV